MKCTIYRRYCSEHKFHHGAEANELREGLEKLISEHAGSTDAEESVPLWRLQRLLDRVDARDSLAYLEARADDEDTEEEP